MWNNQKNKDETIKNQVDELNRSIQNQTISDSLEDNVKEFKKLFQEDDFFKIRKVVNASSGMHFIMMYCEGTVDTKIINENIMKPLIQTDFPKPGPNFLRYLTSTVLQIDDVYKSDKYKEIIERVTYGDTLLLTENYNEALLLNTRNFRTRALEEPETEKILSGPREGFNECLVENLALVRRRLRTSELKMKNKVLGRITKTNVCVCYLDSLVNKSVLKELEKRLDSIDIDAILDSNYITELIKDDPYSPFRSTGYTERPDVVVGKILEGRIAIFVDGSPAVITVPYLFVENFQSSEDYYLSFYYTSFSRCLRILGFLLTISVPAFYIAIVAFHHEMLPTALIINIASERKSVPLPAAVECAIMLLVFDILRETGIRMPSNVGQALNIVGVLVIGQAAVDAKMVAAPMIIIVGITGITNLLIPKMNAPIIYIRIFLLLLASNFGIYGFILGASCVVIHLFNLRSVGVPEICFSGSMKLLEVKDIVIRAPFWDMLTRPKILTKNVVRSKTDRGEKL